MIPPPLTADPDADELVTDLEALARRRNPPLVAHPPCRTLTAASAQKDEAPMTTDPRELGSTGPDRVPVPRRRERGARLTGAAEHADALAELLRDAGNLGAQAEAARAVTRYGYARVSTHEQNPESQYDALASSGVARGHMSSRSCPASWPPGPGWMSCWPGSCRATRSWSLGCGASAATTSTCWTCRPG